MEYTQRPELLDRVGKFETVTCDTVGELENGFQDHVANFENLVGIAVLGERQKDRGKGVEEQFHAGGIVK